MSHASSNRSLVARTSMCGECISEGDTKIVGVNKNVWEALFILALFDENVDIFLLLHVN
jgi:hypothetical protein